MESRGFVLFISMTLGLIISCQNDVDYEDEIQTCPEEEFIINEPNILEYSETTVDWIKPYKFIYEVQNSKEPPLKTVALVFRLDPKGHNTHFEPYVLDILIFYIYSS